MSYFVQSDAKKLIVIDNERYCIEYEGGDKYWYKNGLLHRENGPAVISQYCQIWYLNGRRHREDGPAYIDSHKERKEWYRKGKLHREDGPAVIVGSIKQWWWNGTYCHSKKIFNIKRKNGKISKRIKNV
jgi:antitoxin component YwqK of YwqJK toxin-antitoxin module